MKIVRGKGKIWISYMKEREVTRRIPIMYGGLFYWRFHTERRINERVWRLQWRWPWVFRYWT